MKNDNTNAPHVFFEEDDDHLIITKEDVLKNAQFYRALDQHRWEQKEIYLTDEEVEHFKKNYVDRSNE
jgi:hypothetical protein